MKDSVRHLLIRLFFLCAAFFFVHCLVHFLPGNTANFIEIEAPLGHFGPSLIQNASLIERLKPRAALTLTLTVSATFISFLLSLFLGTLTATLSKGKTHSLISFVLLFFTALPFPWFALLTVIFLKFFFSNLIIHHSFLISVFVISFLFTLSAARLIEQEVRLELKSPSVFSARLRGIGEGTVLFKYAALPCLPLFLNYFSSFFSRIFTGALVTESIFNLQGLGTLFFESLLARNFEMIESSLLVSFLSSFLFIEISRVLSGFFQVRHPA